jgi:hypothetical protein
MSRNIVSGSIRLCYAVVYALFLGFGFAYGADIYQRMSSTQIYGTEDYLCTASHDPNGPWYQRTPGPFWDKSISLDCKQRKADCVSTITLPFSSHVFTVSELEEWSTLESQRNGKVSLISRDLHDLNRS